MFSKSHICTKKSLIYIVIDKGGVIMERARPQISIKDNNAINIIDKK